MENTNHKFFIYFLIAVLFLGTYGYMQLQEANERLESLVDDYDYALRQANENIEEANSNIEDAKRYEGESYEDIDYALYNLETVDTVSTP